MREAVPFFVIISLLAATIISIFGDGGMPTQTRMRATLQDEQERSQELEAYVNKLKNNVHRLQNDPRELERAARERLGMARPDEAVFFFDQVPKDGK